MGGGAGVGKVGRFTLYLLYTAKYYVLRKIRGVKYYVFVDNSKEVTNRTCSSRSRCDNARICGHCARTRQMQIAEVAEKIEQHYGQLYMTVLKPEQNTAEGVRALRASFLRRALAPAGIWTVETGTQFAGLHLNILSPKPIPAKWRNCETYSELLRTTARDAAAYLGKRSGMPAREQYSGKLYGSWGKVSDLLSSPEALPVVQAAAIEYELSGGVSMSRTAEKGGMIEYRTDAEEARGWKEGEQSRGRRVWWCMDGSGEYTYKHPREQHTKEERAAIMRAHLPNIYAAIGRMAA